MSKPSVEELQAAETGLNRAFMIAVAAAVIAFIAGLLLQRGERSTVGWTFYAVAELCLLGAYVWYARAIGRAATFLVPSSWKYVVWVLLAPFLALIPIPIVSTVIGLSPLALKFFFSGQLNSEIQARILAVD